MDRQELLGDFKKALFQLQDALRDPSAGDVFKAGCIQYFEFTFELAWKTIKRVASDEGLPDCNSPKSALKAAFGNGWVESEDIWLDMLSYRNQMSHTYSSEDALSIYDKLSAYADSLQQLVNTLSDVE